jgi:hypothetical protein
VAEVICYQAVSHTAAGVAGSSTGLRTAAAAAPDCIARLMGAAGLPLASWLSASSAFFGFGSLPLVF